MGSDSKVWITMLLVVLLCIGWVSYKKISNRPCITYSIYSKGLNSDNKSGYYIGEIIRFTASLANNKNVIWNFGDHSKEERGSLVSHIYADKGKYVITAKLNGECPVTTSVYIRTPEVIHTHSDDTLINPETIITGNVTPEAGEAATYICNVSANSYEWTILNRKEYKSEKNKIAVFKFKTPGSYNLQLKLNNDRGKLYSKTIYVQPAKIAARPLPVPILIPKRPAPKPEPSTVKKDSVAVPPVSTTPPPRPATTEILTNKPRTIGLPDEAFKSFLEDVVNGDKDAGFFNKYLNNGGETKVKVNKEKKLISFNQFIQSIKGNKKIKIENVKVDRDANKDVLQINVVYTKKKFLGIIPRS